MLNLEPEHCEPEPEPTDNWSHWLLKKNSTEDRSDTRPLSEELRHFLLTISVEIHEKE